ncbi:MAG: helix-turn-helix domain-containing protein [Alkaliphilus sp.]
MENKKSKIHTVCIENNITLSELGRRIGKSKQYMSELSRGNIRLSYKMAVDIANVFDKKPDEIFLNEMSNIVGLKEEELLPENPTQKGA